MVVQIWSGSQDTTWASARLSRRMTDRSQPYTCQHHVTRRHVAARKDRPLLLLCSHLPTSQAVPADLQHPQVRPHIAPLGPAKHMGP